MDSTAEQHFRRIYMSFVESGLLLQDVAWFRWKILSQINKMHTDYESTAIQDSDGFSFESPTSGVDNGHHFEPLKLKVFNKFFIMCALLRDTRSL